MPPARTITLSWDASPSASDADFAGYLIFDNWVTGQELVNQPDLNIPRAFTTSNSYEYPFILFPGDWIFQVRAIDTNGNQSIDALVINISIGDDYSVIPGPALEPYDLVGIGLAGGAVTLTWTAKDINTSGFTAFYSYDNVTYYPLTPDADVIITPTADETEYSITSALLIEPGTQSDVYFKVWARNSALRYERNDNYITVWIDDLAPSNATGISTELVG